MSAERSESASGIDGVTEIVLILDEPTNDLDISTLTIWKIILDHYQGIVIICVP